MKQIVLFLLISSVVHAASTRKLIHDKNTIELNFEEKRHTYLSKNCKDIEKCFFIKKPELRYQPNQSPGFTLCYLLEGEPFFGMIEGQKEKEPICKKGKFFANHEALLYYYRDHIHKGKK